MSEFTHSDWSPLSSSYPLYVDPNLKNRFHADLTLKTIFISISLKPLRKSPYFLDKVGIFPSSGFPYSQIDGDPAPEEHSVKVHPGGIRVDLDTLSSGIFKVRCEIGVRLHIGPEAFRVGPLDEEEYC